MNQGIDKESFFAQNEKHCDHTQSYSALRLVFEHLDALLDFGFGIVEEVAVGSILDEVDEGLLFKVEFVDLVDFLALKER